MRQGIIVNAFPVPFYECRNQKQQGAWRLVEVGYHAFRHLRFISRREDNLRAGMQGVQPVAFHVVQDVLQGFCCAEGRVGFVWLPLPYVQVRFLGVGMLA